MIQIKELSQNIPQSSQPLLQLVSRKPSAPALLSIPDLRGARPQVGFLYSHAIINTANKSRPAAPSFEGQGCAACLIPHEAPAHTFQAGIHEFRQRRVLDSECQHRRPHPRYQGSFWPQMTFPHGRKGHG